MKTNLWRYYLTSSLFCAARMGIGATSVIFMISSGASLSDVAMTKVIQALVVFFAEVPTGLLADTFGRKTSILAAAVCSLLSFAVFGASTTVIGFSIAEILNGLCISFWSGSFEAVVIDDTKANEQGGAYLEFIFSRMGTYNALATMVGGLLGGVLADVNPLMPFGLSAVLMLITFISMTALIPKDKNLLSLKRYLSLSSRIRAVSIKIIEHNNAAWKFSLSSASIREFFLLQIAIQFTIQPILHYWQPYFQSFSNEVTAQTLGIIFFVYVGSQFIFSGVISRLFEKNLISNENVNSWTALLTFACFAAMLITSQFLVAVIAFVVVQGALNVLRNNLGANFNRFVTNSERATILSAVSFISRLGMLASLLILKITAGHLPISLIFLISTFGIAAVIMLVFRWNKYVAVSEAP